MSDILDSQSDGTGPAASVDEKTEDRSLEIKVNGLTVKVTERIGIHKLLVKAKSVGAIEGIIDEYAIERVSEDGRYGLEDTITVKADEEFLAIPTGPTPVAWSSDIARLERTNGH